MHVIALLLVKLERSNEDLPSRLPNKKFLSAMNLLSSALRRIKSTSIVKCAEAHLMRIF